ncbi:MAG: hypothetical protein FJX77_09565, partial [Armatimonadetes bacterium]|nr:hypothetical protein [Armatimonadota bacterium]
MLLVSDGAMARFRLPVPVVLAWTLSGLGICLWAGCASPPAPSTTSRLPDDPYVGAQVCGECHRKILDRQSRSPHALTLRTAAPETLSGKVDPAVRVRDPDGVLEYGIAERGGRLVQLLFREGKEIGATPFHYLLGSGTHGVSPLHFTGDDWRYLKITHYARGGWGISPLHGVPQDANDRRKDEGWPLTQADVGDCLRCHTTRLQFGTQGLDETASEFGVRCETCHGPGRAHVEAARAKQKDLAIENPQKWT